jgi:hypothetical protein
MGKSNSERKLDIPVRSHPNYSSIEGLLKSGKWEDAEIYYKKKAEIRLAWEEKRFRVCAWCGEKLYRELFTGDSKYCKKCVYEKRNRAKQKKKLYKYSGESKSDFHAKQVVYHLKKMGLLKEEPCEVCGELKVEAHHKDYKKPWVVNWLCRKHHYEWHKKNKPGRTK